MKKIITKSKTGVITEILVDDEDYDYLNAFSWRLVRAKRTLYATRTTDKSERELGYPTCIRMHRQILNVEMNKTKFVDHENHNGIDNQKSNLRICTASQNQGNRHKYYKNHTSKYKGVRAHRQRWRAYIRVNNDRIHLGCFSTEDSAAIAYNEAALCHFGEYASLNIINH